MPTNINDRKSVAIRLLVAAAGFALAASVAHAAGGGYIWDAGGSNPAAPTDGGGSWSTTAANWSDGSTNTGWNNTFTGTSPYSSVLGSGTLEPNSSFNYMYCPSIMYDPTDGMYKVWTGYNTNSMPGGDHISFEEAPTLAGLANAPVTTALAPNYNNPSYFDSLDACDPNVYVDPTTGIYYMAYDGNTNGTGLSETTRIGIAESTNGGATFTPVYTSNSANGYALIAPGSNVNPSAYGTGQPAVVRANDGYWYMIYTNAQGNGPPDSISVIRSTSPTFANAQGVADYTTVTSFSPTEVGGYSLDMAYNAATSQFVIAANTTPVATTPIGNNSMELSFFNSNWSLASQENITANNLGFSFGEGIGLLSSSDKQLLNNSQLTFVGATINATDRANNEWAYWVRGNFSYLNLAVPNGVPATNTATFGSNNGTAGTVTLGANITVGGLTFNPATSGNYTIAGSGSYTLELTGSSVVANANATLAANTTFDNGLDLTGGQQLTLSGTNTNATGTTVAAGTLQVVQPDGTGSGNFSAPLGTGNVTVDTGAVLAFNSNNGSGTLSNNINITGNVNNGFGVANNNGALQFVGNNQTYTDNGNITLNSSSTTQTQIFNFGINTTVNLNGVISGTVGQLNLWGQSSSNADMQTFNLNTQETYTGDTLIGSYAAGTLVTLNGGTNTLPTGGALILDSANWNNGASPVTLNLDGNNQSVAVLTVQSFTSAGNNNGNVLIENTSSTPAALTTTMEGIANSSGSVNINIGGGTFTIGKGVTLNASPTQTWDTVLGPNATMNVDAGATFNAGFYSMIQGTLNVSGTAANTGEWLVSFGGGPGAININQGGVVESYQTRIGSSNTPATVNVNTGGTLAASYIHSAAGTIHSTTDFLNVNGGTLENGPYTTPGSTPSYSLQAAWITNQVTVQLMAGGATINDSGQYDVASPGNPGGGPNNQIGQNYNLLVAAPIVSGVASGADGGLTITGGGTVTLANTNTYTGPTTIQSGTLALGTYTYISSGGTSVIQTGSIAKSSSITVNSGATFDVSALAGGYTIGSRQSLIGSGTVKGNLTVLGTLQPDPSGSAGTLTFDNNLTISGSTINVALDSSGNADNIVINGLAAVSGTNTINISALGNSLNSGLYTLLSDANGGLAGTFLFGNGGNSETYTLGSNNYLLSLANSNTAETLKVAAVPEPATLGLLALGGVGLVYRRAGRRKRNV
ncbi:MAG: beta strand repeat-containing protein [Phycisphaerae bacterium]